MISDKSHAKRKKRIAFILFIMVFIGVVIGGFAKALKETSTFSDAIVYWWQIIVEKGLYIPFVGSLLIWIYFRVKYKAEFER